MEADRESRPRRRGGPPRLKLTTVVRDQILDNIRSGKWKIGDRLPTEAQLGDMLGVSRAPIREAVQSLVLLGVIDISPRRGAFVRAIPMESIVNMAILAGTMDRDRPTTDIFEFRHATEGAIAELAARNARGADIDILRGIIGDNVEAVQRGDRREAQRIDLEFHKAVAEASGNMVFQATVAALNGLLTELRRTISGLPGASEAALAEHRAIFDAIARHDTAAARRNGEVHVTNVESRYLAARRASPQAVRMDRPDARDSQGA